MTQLSEERYQEDRWHPTKYALLVAMALACTSCGDHSAQSTSQPTVPIASATAGPALLQLNVYPEGSTVWLDDQARGVTPLLLSLPAGRYTVAVAHSGYATRRQEVQLYADGSLLLTGKLNDTEPPRVTLSELPMTAPVGQQVLIGAAASDNEGVSRLRLSIDGRTVLSTGASSLGHTWETEGLAAGVHTIVVQATDLAGNAYSLTHRIDLIPPTPTPTPTPSLRPVATPTPVPRVRAYTQTITLLSYPFQPYLKAHLDPTYHFQVLSLDRGAYESSSPTPQSLSFQAVVLENRYLQLIFLPELGGRLYQCVLKWSGQQVFYQNPVLKPSYWGPLSREENWWLAAGGLEWALPLAEHGYESAISWSYTIERRADAITLVLSDTPSEERGAKTRLQTEIRVTLPADQAIFIIEPRLHNPTGQTQSLQFWLNAMLTLGASSMTPNTEFVFPTERMIVHSTGDPALSGPHEVISWPVADGRDLAFYRNWHNWLGVFVSEVSHDFVGAYNHDSGVGLVRIFPMEVAAGVKLFGFGSGFGARQEYTDDGSEYFEMWGGPCRTFWPEDNLTLASGKSLQWQETWIPVWGIGGIGRPTADVVVRAGVVGNVIEIGVAATRARQLWLQVDWDGNPIYEATPWVSPENPASASIPIPGGHLALARLEVHVMDTSGLVLVTYAKDIVP